MNKNIKIILSSVLVLSFAVSSQLVTAGNKSKKAKLTGNPELQALALNAFKNDDHVRNAIEDLEDKYEAVKIGNPTAVLDSVMGEDCSYMEFYNITQKMGYEEKATTAVSARVWVIETDLECAGEFIEEENSQAPKVARGVVEVILTNPKKQDNKIDQRE